MPTGRRGPGDGYSEGSICVPLPFSFAFPRSRSEFGNEGNGAVDQPPPAG
jgi:hypothetical protein